MSFTPLLTPRQREVAVLKANGYTAQEIAAKLHMVKTTADQHVARICRRTRARTVTHAIAILLATGEISPSEIEIPGWRRDIAV